MTTKTTMHEAGAAAKAQGDLYAAAGTGLVALLLTGALFGFFYAWVCSTMWGLDAADPRTAIAAMQAMNASVRNPLFFPAFFLTAPALGIAALMAERAGARLSAALLLAAALLVALGCVALTATVNVPMNRALAGVAVPEDIGQAAEIWAGYSPRWQLFNTLRTGVAGVALLVSGIALWRLPR